MISFGVLASIQRAGIDEDAPAVHHEGVEDAVVDEHDLHVLLREPGDAQDRRGVVAQQLLDLGVADERQAAWPGLGCARAGWPATQRARRPSRSAIARDAGIARRALLGVSPVIRNPRFRLFRRKLGTRAAGVNARPRSRFAGAP